jgi:sugar phosphate isomerase/epimerase
MARPLSLCYYTVPELSFTQMIDVAADAGCDYVGVRLLDGAPTEPPTALLRDAALRREALARMRDRGVRALDASAARLRGDTRADAFAPMLHVCEELGVHHVACSIDDPDVARSAETLSALCALARRHDVRVEIEFVPWMAVGSLADAAALVRATDAPNLGILVDALHLDRSGGSPDDIGELPPTWFRLAQICDAPVCTDFSKADQIRVATQARCLPGDGALPLAALLRALPPEVPLCLEIPMRDLARHVAALDRVKAAVIAARRLLEDTLR